MSFYRDQVLPRFQDKVMARQPNRAVRARVCEGLHGADTYYFKGEPKPMGFTYEGRAVSTSESTAIE